MKKLFLLLLLPLFVACSSHDDSTYREIIIGSWGEINSNNNVYLVNFTKDKICTVSEYNSSAKELTEKISLSYSIDDKYISGVFQ